MVKTNAEKCREYRARKKAEKKKLEQQNSTSVQLMNQDIVANDMLGATSSGSNDPVNSRSHADYCRKYYEKKKAARKLSQTSEQSNEFGAKNKILKTVVDHQNQQILNFASNRSDSSDEEFGENQHDVIVVEAQVYQANSPAPINHDHERSRNLFVPACRPKTDVERNREYRARKKIAALENNDEITIASLPKTPAERSREYRARQKNLRAINHQVDNIDDDLASANETLYENNDTSDDEDDIGAATSDSDSLTDNDEHIYNSNIPLPYSNFHRFRGAHKKFEKKFSSNAYGYACSVCDRLWFSKDLKPADPRYENILNTVVPDIPKKYVKLCNTCRASLSNNRIPTMATYNGFKYPAMPDHLPPLNLVSERLISPRLPFTQIRRLRHVNGQYGIYGQIINVPVPVDTMVKNLPRNLDDDHCINVHMKRKIARKSSFLFGLVQKRTIKSWLQFLIPSPLYTTYDITVDQSFFNGEEIAHEYSQDYLSEHIPIEESLTAQQETLMWNDEQYKSLLFDEHAEELSFPSIYLGQFRHFREGVKVTPFTMASSELRRSDRRGVTPQHLLYMAMKIMRHRVRDSLTVAFEHIGKDTKMTREQIEDEAYINGCVESNLAFLRSIPNSAWYWMHRKKDLFAMMRQLGKPTAFLTVSANEIGWSNLIQTIYRLKNSGASISEELAEELHYMEKAKLINEDSVTCAIYFHKLVEVLMSILKSPRYSPFGEHHVIDYFIRIEFQHRGSPDAHILLWLANTPWDIIDKNKSDAIKVIDELISVSSNEASGNIKLQTHKHTFTCYKNVIGNRQQCRFEAPFMPSRSTIILMPMQKEESRFSAYAQRFKSIRVNLEANDYPDIDTFYQQNNIASDDDYHQIIRAGIKRPRVFLKRQPLEKWHNPFNPFIFNIMKSNMDIQFITDEYSCANYVSEYVNKTNRGISQLQRQIIQTMDEHPEFDIVEVTRKIGVNMLNNVEMSSQEAAWYLLRKPMSKSSAVIVSIPTVWPSERQRIRKTNEELDKMNIDSYSTDVWNEHWFDKYEERHDDLEEITLAQFVANYTSCPDRTYKKRKLPRVIRYSNYDMAQDLNEYKREMVTLHFPFRNEDEEILAETKFVGIYDSNEQLILTRREEFEASLDINKTIEICKNLCREEEFLDDDETHDVGNMFPEPNPFELMYNDPGAEMNSDLRLAVLNKLGAIVKEETT